MHWRTRRKLYYTTLVILPLVITAGIIYYSVFFPTPTCFDGEQNGSETGVDCGGTCQRVCQKDTASSTVKWSRSFRVSGDIYNAAAYIQNPNVSLMAKSVPYKFRLFDKDGLLIAERRGTMDILPQPLTLAFEAGIDTNNRTVARTEFTWLQPPFWQNTRLRQASFPVSNKTLTGPTSSTPRLTFDITNPSVRDYTDITIAALIRDGAGNPVHVSRTRIGQLQAQSTKSGVFTWRRPFATHSSQCTTSTDIMLLVDRSESMAQQRADLPRPFTTATSAASRFTKQSSTSTRLGLVSFASEPSLDQQLAGDHNKILQAINSLSIQLSNEQDRTNLGTAVRIARSALSGSQERQHKDVIVILTDGKANAPRPPGGEAFARRQIMKAKRSGVTVYTVGIGQRVNQRFLAQIASAPKNYFQVADPKALSDIYKAIHNDVCKQAPFITEIIPTHYKLKE